MTYEDFTTYTEVDPNSHIAKTAQHVDWQDRRNEDAYLYDDKGAGHFTDFTHLIDAKRISSTSSGTATFWLLSNAVDDARGLLYADETAVLLQFYGDDEICFEEFYNGNEYYQSHAITAGTMYYIKLEKSGTSLSAKFYSDAARTNLLFTVSLTLHADHSFRYIFVCDTWNSGDSHNGDTDIENLDLQEVAGWTGKVSGVTNPAKVMGVAAANIAKVKGVA